METAAEEIKNIDLRQLFSLLIPGISSNSPLLLCLFHSDKNPSLNPAYAGADGRQRWHCFGCGAGGNAIDLIQAVARLNGGDLSFPEALARLSKLTGVEVDPTFSEAYQARRLQRERLQKVADYFKGCLQTHPTDSRARSWLIERGVPPETWERLPIGIYPPWEEIKSWAREQEIPRDWLKEERLLVGAAHGGDNWTGALAFFYGLSFNKIGRIKLRIPREKGPHSYDLAGKEGS